MCSTGTQLSCGRKYRCGQGSAWPHTISDVIVTNSDWRTCNASVTVKEFCQSLLLAARGFARATTAGVSLSSLTPSRSKRTMNTNTALNESTKKPTPNHRPFRQSANCRLRPVCSGSAPSALRAVPVERYAFHPLPRFAVLFLELVLHRQRVSPPAAPPALVHFGDVCFPVVAVNQVRQLLKTDAGGNEEDSDAPHQPPSRGRVL